MSLASAAARLVESAVELPARFAEVAAHDPLSALLLLVGAAITGASVAVFGYLALGALASLFTGDWASAPSRGAR